MNQGDIVRLRQKHGHLSAGTRGKVFSVNTGEVIVNFSEPFREPPRPTDDLVTFYHSPGRDYPEELEPA